jgi:hypothetical protein
LIDLKVGDKAYWIFGSWDYEVITITGECDEGDGYTAHSPKFAAEHPETDPSDPEAVSGAVHTCNGFLAKTRKEARAESLRLARKLRAEYAAKQAEYSRGIQYLDWVIARKGKH